MHCEHEAFQNISLPVPSFCLSYTASEQNSRFSNSKKTFKNLPFKDNDKNLGLSP